MLDLPPIRFMAMARVVWASVEMEPSDMAPVAKRLTMSLAGSTSSSGIRGALRPKFEQAAQRQVALGLIVDQRRILIGLVLAGAGRMLQLGDGIRRPDVFFSADAKAYSPPASSMLAEDGIVGKASVCRRIASSATSKTPMPWMWTAYR